MRYNFFRNPDGVWEPWESSEGEFSEEEKNDIMLMNFDMAQKYLDIREKAKSI
ncbi:hypothetical protein SEA_FAUST_8 [Streptomyces phage Faust]|uniref:Uncharacterized protein n=1 Tax=Streptomyces phage Faust TaxID=2767565 RepID=A0A7G9UYK9_9CAUD|nr:hypothetical protein PP456_gp008 [Streptomyces phage Faust]QNN99114.1 hypothetical protein SEA_FAUST_8 [Streptomyces phage Faust]